MSPRLGPYSLDIPPEKRWRGGNGRHPELCAPGLRNHFVYWLYDESGEVIYVGCTRRPEGRWREHCKGNPRLVGEVFHKYMAGPYDYETARRVEKEQQYKHKPRHDSRWATPLPVLKKCANLTAERCGPFEWQIFESGEPTVRVHESEVEDWMVVR